MRRRWNRLAGVVALVATVAAGAAAFRIDPEVLTQVATPPTGLWVPAPVSGDIVHVDATTGRPTARVNVSEPGAELEVEESDAGVIVVDRTAGGVSLVDPALHDVIRSVGSVASPGAMVDIGPAGIVTASGSTLSLVDAEVTRSSNVVVPPNTRSVVVDGAGAQVENGASRVAVGDDGVTEDEGGSDGVLVRIGDRVLTVAADGVHTLGGSRVACFDGPVIEPTAVVGSSIGWVVAVVGPRIHVADSTNGQCAVVDLGDSVGELGRPVVAGRRVYVPERLTGAVHIIEPSRAVETVHDVLPPGDLRLRARGDFVAAYDTTTPIAALLNQNGVVHFVDTSVDERGIATVIDSDGTATVVDDDAGDAATNTGADGVSADPDAPVIDPGVLASTLRDAGPVDDVSDGDLVANFAFSTTSVVVGEAVRFVDGSTGGPETWMWDFGDGTGAEGPEVEKAWDEPGTYDVTLRVGRGDETDAISLAITVVPAGAPLPPSADFVSSTTVVGVGRAVSFEDRSDGEIERWRWDFGDGTTASDPDVTKSWSRPGRYVVELVVSNSQGSDDASVVIEVVDGLRAPVAVLTASDTEIDLGSPVVFTASSTTDPAAYSWDFGDGRTSTGRQVTHVFLSEGEFTVTVEATNDAGRSTATATIFVTPPTRPPVAAIGTLPDVIEVGDVVTLSSISTNAPTSIVWAFGDGGTATGARVTHTWESPGSYIISLTARNNAGASSITKTVEVVAELPPPVARIGDHVASPWVGQTTLFVDASVGATSWLWDFGDGVTSNARDPLHTFSTPGQKLVTLTVTNRNGSDSTSVIVEPRLEPVAAFTASNTAIRAGDTVVFTDESVNAVSWSWVFGDGTTSTARNPTHAYDAAGDYPVTLTVRNATGDADSFGPVTISVDPAAPRLSGIVKGPSDTGSITTLSTATFTAVTHPSSGPIDLYQIDFGDGSAFGQNGSGTFSHAYDQSGTYVVSMQARGPLGDFSAPVTRTVTVVDPPPPLVDIAASVPGSAPVGVVRLTGEQLSGSGPVATWRWQITQGNNSWDLTGRVVDHSFEAPGVYRIRLTAESPVAAVPDDEVARNITITVPPAPVINSLTANPAPATAGVLVTFTPSVTGSVAAWEWDFEGGGTSYVELGPTGQHIFNTPGPKRVFLRVTGPFGQQAVETVDLTVNPKPAPTVPVASPGGTVDTGTTVDFTSSDAGGRTGLTWDWTIAKGSTVVNYADSGRSISHTFTSSGTWTVTVRATDSLGVSGTNTLVVTVQDPLPPLVAGFTSAPAGPLEVQLTDTSTGPPISSWSWNFGSPTAVGNTSARNPSVTYAAPGTYSVTLVVTSGGTTDQITLPVTVG